MDHDKESMPHLQGELVVLVMVTQLGSQDGVILVERLFLQAACHKYPHDFSILSFYWNKKEGCNRIVKSNQKQINKMRRTVTCFPDKSSFRIFSNVSM